MALRTTVQDREYDKFIERTSDNHTAIAVDAGAISGDISIIPASSFFYNSVSINSAGWTLVPLTVAVDVITLSIRNNTGVSIKIRHDDAGAGVTSGYPIYDRDRADFTVTDSFVIYARSDSGTVTLDLFELRK